MEIGKLKKELRRQESRRAKKGRSRLLPAILLLLGLLAGFYFLFLRPEARLQRVFARAEALVEERRYEEALAAFRSLHDEHGEVGALFRSAEILDLYLERHREAILAYLLVQKDHPGAILSFESGVRVAEIYKKKLLDYPRAIVAYQKLLDSGGAGGDNIQYEVADAYFRLGNFEQARIELESLVENYPESAFLAEAGYRIGVIYSLDGVLPEAQEQFRYVTEKWPESRFAVEARFALASVLEEAEELEEALGILRDLEALYPKGDVLSRKTEQVAERIRKKQKAI